MQALMTLNGIAKIKDGAGDYIVLTDYGMEGIAVSHQAQTAQEAVRWMMTCGYTANQSIVKLVRINGDDCPNDPSSATARTTMSTAFAMSVKQNRPRRFAEARGSDDDWSWWHEAIKAPEYRLRTWAWLALAAAFVGDEDRMNEYTALAEREKAIIASRQNAEVRHGGPDAPN